MNQQGIKAREPITEEVIIERLKSRFSNNIRYKLWNCFIFGGWETDFFLQQEASGYSYEIEIKISRGDFFGDMKKIDKHSIIEHGYYMKPKKQWDTDIKGWIDLPPTKTEQRLRPHRFYYCVPENLVYASEVPKYAGLMYVRESDIITVKEAPLIHREKIDFRNILCDKFYYYNAELRMENYRLREQVEYYKELLKEKSVA